MEELHHYTKQIPILMESSGEPMPVLLVMVLSNEPLSEEQLSKRAEESLDDVRDGCIALQNVEMLEQDPDTKLWMLTKDFAEHTESSRRKASRNSFFRSVVAGFEE